MYMLIINQTISFNIVFQSHVKNLKKKKGLPHMWSDPIPHCILHMCGLWSEQHMRPHGPLFGTLDVLQLRSTA